MCQAYDGERRYVVRGELDEIAAAARKHFSGEEPLSEDQLRELLVRKMMLEEE